LHKQERLDLYRNSVEILLGHARDDLRNVIEVREEFPNLRIVMTSCRYNDATVLFDRSYSKPRLCLELGAGDYLNDQRYGVWPAESATYHLREFTTGGSQYESQYESPWRFGYLNRVPEEQDQRNPFFLRLREEGEEKAFFQTAFAHVEKLSLRADATKVSHLRAIVDSARNLKSLNVIVAKGSKQSKDETKKQLAEVIIELGRLECLKHLALFIRNAKLALFPEFGTLSWKALESLECNISPDRILKQRYGHSCKPPQLLSRPQSPPSGTLRKVVVHLDGQIYEPPNPAFFAYALLEMFPSSVEISCNVAEASSFEGGHKCWDYQSGFDALAFSKWVEEAHNSMRSEMVADSPQEPDYTEDGEYYDSDYSYYDY
jgi:hypothetical protein